jgi:NADH-quinone oxidoreductase subunit N
VATFVGLGTVAADARQTLCLPGGGQCMYAADSVASALQLAALLGAAVTLLLSWPDDRKERAGGTAVIVSLVLAATAGATAVAGARDVGSWLVALELATLPTVALVALRGARSAISGAVALLTTALVSFGLLALAAALWFTATSSGFLTPEAMSAVLEDSSRRPILVLAVVLVVAGIGFKLSLVPFHAWTPEAYDGAPLPIAAFLAGVSKIAALAALLVVIRAIAPLGAPVLTSIALVAAASMTLGNIMALRQDGVVRLLAWSTVAQAGWVVLPLATLSAAAVRASGAYLLAYVLATLLAFAVVAALVQTRGAARARDVTAYGGLMRDHPVWPLPWAWRCCRWRGCRRVCSVLWPRSRRCGPWSPASSGCWPSSRWSTPSWAWPSTCAGFAPPSPDQTPHLRRGRTGLLRWRHEPSGCIPQRWWLSASPLWHWC